MMMDALNAMIINMGKNAKIVPKIVRKTKAKENVTKIQEIVILA